MFDLIRNLELYLALPRKRRQLRRRGFIISLSLALPELRGQDAPGVIRNG